ncbi:tape measure protein [Winkia sp. UMB0889B]|uniref:tape measure protein n=1 Tax=Winkia sp. UMB0889B TaxID=3046315 RepID=UPI002555EF0A|nr:tape measure protein [Winkia sp. UMB0889B]MDK7904868.1 tape measure protein [Winkia sp. UMB0889B]
MFGSQLKKSVGAASKGIGSPALEELQRSSNKAAKELSALQALAGKAGGRVSSARAAAANAERALANARRQSANANGAIRVAETKLAEAVKKYGSESSQAVAAAERLQAAKRKAATASDNVRAKEEALERAQHKVSQAERSQAEATAKVAKAQEEAKAAATRYASAQEKVAAEARKAAAEARALRQSMQLPSLHMPKAVAEAFGRVSGAVSNAASVISTRFNNATAPVMRVGKAVDRGVNSTLRAAGKVAIGAAAAIGTTLTGSIGSAVSRVDTLNNFPRIMANLGYSASDAAKSAKKLSEKLRGLPTSLQDIMPLVQQIAPLTGSLDEATNVGLAFNNMLVASGKSTADQSRAMQQYTQMLATGKVDMMSWKTLMEVMPAQMNQLAESLLGAGKSGFDLYDALRDGKLTMEDVNKAMVKLNDEGGSKFASFAKQAKDASKGIQTAWTNLKTRITGAMASIIQAIGPEKISGALDRVGAAIGKIGDAFDRAASGPGSKAFSATIGHIASLMPMVGAAVTPLLTKLPLIGGAFRGVGGPGLWVIAIFGSMVANSKKLQDALSKVANKLATAFSGSGAGAQNALGGISDLLGRLGDTIAPIVGLVGSLAASLGGVLLNAALSVLGALADLAAKISGNKVAMTALQVVLTGLVGAWGLYKTVTTAATAATAITKAAFGTLSFALKGAAVAQRAITAATALTKVALGGLSSKLRIAAVAQAAFNAVMAINPIVLVVAGIAALVAALVWFFTQTEAGRKAWRVFTVYLTTAWQAIKATAVAIWQGLAAFFSGLWENIKTVVFTAWEAIKAIFAPAIEFIKNLIIVFAAVLLTIWQGISAAVMWVWNGIVAFLTPIITTITTVISTGIEFVRGIWASVWGWVSSFFTAIWNGIVAFFTPIINRIRSIIAAVTGAIRGIWASVWGWVSSFFSGVWNNLVGFASGAISRLAGVLGRIRSAVWGAVAGAGSWLVQTGRNIITGLWRGISGAIGWLRSLVSNALGSIVSWAKSKLGIHSPSRVFRDQVGAMISEGIAVGITTRISSARGAMSDLVDGAQEELQGLQGVRAAVSVAGTAAAGGAGMARNVVTQTFNVRADDPEAAARYFNTRTRQELGVIA